jgi:hypothetical protein
MRDRAGACALVSEVSPVAGTQGDSFGICHVLPDIGVKIPVMKLQMAVCLLFSNPVFPASNVNVNGVLIFKKSFDLIKCRHCFLLSVP